jgi:outer membrane protein
VIRTALLPRILKGTAAAAAIVGCAAVIPAALNAQQAEPALTVQAAVETALEHNPDYRAQRNDVEAARWNVRAAYGSLLPTASASSSFGYSAAGPARVGVFELGRQDESYSSSYSAGITYSLSGATLLRPASARANARATDARVAGGEASLVSNVVQQYLAVLQATDEARQATRELERTAEHVRLAEARLRVGSGTSLDLKRAEVQEGQARVRVLQTEHAAAAAKLSLEQILGVRLEPGTRLISEFGLFEPHWGEEALLEEALRLNPGLVAARSSADAARVGVQSARSAYLPSLSFSLGVSGYTRRLGSIDPLIENQLAGMAQQFEGCQRDNRLRQLIGDPPRNCAAYDPAAPGLEAALRREFDQQASKYPFGYDTQPLGASLTFSVPIFTGMSRQNQVAQARLTADNARLQSRAHELRLRSEVAGALQSVETAYRTALLQDQVRETATEELRLAQERFRMGAASSIELTDAQTNVARAEQDQIAAVYGFHRSVAALEALIGRPLR